MNTRGRGRGRGGYIASNRFVQQPADPNNDPNKSNGKITFKLDKFSEFANAEVGCRRLSNAVYIRGLPWKILVISRMGQFITSQKCFGYFLQCNANDSDPTWSCRASATLKIISQKAGKEDNVRRIYHVLHAKENDWGFAQLMMFNKIMNPRMGLYNEEDDSIILEVDVFADVPKFNNPPNTIHCQDEMCANKIQSLQKSIDEKTKIIIELEKSKEEMNKELEQTKADLSKKEVKNQELKNKLKAENEMVEACLTLKSHLNTDLGNQMLRTEIEELKIQLAAEKANNESLKNTNDQLESQLAAENAKNKDISRTLRKFAADIDKDEKGDELLAKNESHEYKALKARNDNMKMDLEELDKKFRELNQEN